MAATGTRIRTIIRIRMIRTESLYITGIRLYNTE